MARRRNARSKKIKRRQRAKTVQDYLIDVLQSAGKQPAELPNKAAVHLIKSSQRHRLPLPQEGKELVCRKCWSAHTTSTAFRVRIKAGQRIKTCLSCGTVRRYGGGPGFHRNVGRRQ